MKISFPRLFDNRYVSLISLYVIPPATKTNILGLFSTTAPPGFAALCQAGF